MGSKKIEIFLPQYYGISSILRHLTSLMQCNPNFDYKLIEAKSFLQKRCQINTPKDRVTEIIPI